MAVECGAHDGLHIFEDAYVVQVLDPETGDPAPDGQLGSLCVTELYKTGSPQFRYNIMDLAALHPPGRCACGSWLRRMTSFAGRGDNMVKLRGVNVWPEAVGEIAAGVPGVGNDYFVRAVRRDNRDELVLSAVSEPHRRRSSTPSAATLEERLRDRLGVRIEVEVVVPGSLDALDGPGDGRQVEALPRRARRGPFVSAPAVGGRATVGTVDYLCNAFGPGAGRRLGRRHRRPGPDPQDPTGPRRQLHRPRDMVARMDALGIATVVVAAADPETHGSGFAFSDVAASFAEVESLSRRHPGASPPCGRCPPIGAMAGVRRAEEALDGELGGGPVRAHPQPRPSVRPRRLLPLLRAGRRRRGAGGDAGRDLRGADAERSRAVPSGSTGRRCTSPRPTSCSPTRGGRGSTRLWRWHSRSATSIWARRRTRRGAGRRRWSTSSATPGGTKVLFGTNFPTVGHRHALGQLGELGLDDDRPPRPARGQRPPPSSVGCEPAPDRGRSPR